MELIRPTQKEDTASPKSGSAGSQADLCVWFTNKDGWKVEFASSRARQWARSNLNFDRYEQSEYVFRSDLAGINSLIHRSNLAGLVVVHMAPRSSYGGTTNPSEG